MEVNLDKYLAEVQAELDRAAADFYRLEGALALLRKIKAEADAAEKAAQEKE